MNSNTDAAALTVVSDGAQEPPVRCHSLRLEAGDRHLLENADLVCAAGSSHAVMGPSGSGKTSLLHAICGLRAPAGGSVSILGSDVWAMSSKARAALRLNSVGLVLQFPELIAELSVLENVALPVMLQRQKHPRKSALKALAQVGLADQAKQHPATLSGGEAQRVAIARALVVRPAVIVADEPTGSVDGPMATLITDLLVDLARNSGAALILATHDPQVAERLDAVVRFTSGGLARTDATVSTRGKTSA